jgi:pimeloyl-ACP methyl ester carboxylesterase
MMVMVCRVLAASVALAVAVPATANAKSAFTQERARSIVGNLQQVVTEHGIDKQMLVPINGTKQSITIRGRDMHNPILLFIHGGPAAPEMPTSWTFQNPWEDYFTVVQWDQRGAGKTYNANDPAKIAPTITLPQMVSDTEAMVRYLRATYAKPKIFVLGHSWGSLLGIILAHNHPEWLYAYVGVGQMIDSPKAERLDYLKTLEIAKASNNAPAVRELTALEPYPERDGSIPRFKLDAERKWSVTFGGLSWRRDSYAYYYRASELSPDYTNADLDAIDKGSLLSLSHLGPAFATFNYSNVTNFGCPIVLFEGRHDFTTSSEVSAEWFGRVHAPYKKIVWFENAAHMIQIEEPGRVLVHLVEDVRPLAGKHAN